MRNKQQTCSRKHSHLRESLSSQQSGVCLSIAETCSQAQTAGAGTLAQQDLQLSAVAVVLAMLQVVGAASQATDEEEDLSLPVSLDADLMLAVSIICIGICFIAVWEFFKWCLQGVISRREAGPAVSSLSPRKARKLQRLRDQTAQVIQAEIFAREEAASLQPVAAASRRRPSQTTRTPEQAGGAPTRYFANPRGPSSTALRPVPRLPTRTGLLSFKCASSARGALPTTLSTAQGRNYPTLTGWISQ